MFFEKEFLLFSWVLFHVVKDTRIGNVSNHSFHESLAHEVCYRLSKYLFKDIHSCVYAALGIVQEIFKGLLERRTKQTIQF